MTDATEHDGSPAQPPASTAADSPAEGEAVESSRSTDPSPAQIDSATTPESEAAQSEDASDADDVSAAIVAAGENVAADLEAAPARVAEAQADTGAEADTVVEGEASAEAAPESTADAEAAATAEDDGTADATESESADTESEQALDDIAPGTTGPDQSDSTLGSTADGRSANKVSIWPFVIYDVLWVVFAGLMVWQFEALPADTAMYEAELYPVALLVGLILLIAGPLLIFVSWIAAWGRPGSSKGRLLISALIRGSVATLIGVGIWWIALLVLDQLRLGMLL